MADGSEPSAPKMRLSAAALQRLEDQADASYGIGDEQFANDLGALLKFYKEAIGAEKSCSPPKDFS